MNFNSLSIGKKLVLSISILVCVFFTAITVIIFNVQSLQETVRTHLEAHDLRDNLKQAYIDHLLWMKKVTIVFTDSNTQNIDVQTDSHLCNFGKWYYSSMRTEIEKVYPQLAQNFATIEKPHELLHQSIIELNEVLSHDAVNKTQLIQTIYRTKIVPNVEAVTTALNNNIEIINTVSTSNDDVISTQQDISYIAITAACIIALLSIFIISIILRTVSRPLKDLLPYFLNISNGIIGQKSSIKGTDEIGQLAMSFNKMNDKMKEIVQEINTGAESIVEGSSQINSSSQSLSQRVEEQVHSAEIISAAIEQMTANISQAKDNSLHAVGDFEIAGKKMIAMNNASNESLIAIETINSKISIINSIAAQTNILALNAAVEAARAGEQGRGFAIVAGEVRKLAELSKKAADDINELSGKTLTLTNNTKQLSDELTHSFKKSIQLVNEVGAALTELSIGAEQINNSTIKMNSISQSNAASSEELAASAEEFTGHAHMLQDVISFFSIDESTSKIKKTELISWGPKYYIGLSTIDNQHKVLVDLINKTYQHYGSDGNKKKLKEVLNELIEYTKFHFGEEEKYFKQFGFTDIDAHKAKHEQFVNKMKHFAEDINAGDTTVSFDIIDFLKNWLIQHILKSDVQYVPLFKQHGVK